MKHIILYNELFNFLKKKKVSVEDIDIVEDIFLEIQEKYNLKKQEQYILLSDLIKESGYAIYKIANVLYLVIKIYENGSFSSSPWEYKNGLLGSDIIKFTKRLKKFKYKTETFRGRFVSIHIKR